MYKSRTYNLNIKSINYIYPTRSQLKIKLKIKYLINSTKLTYIYLSNIIYVCYIAIF